MAKKQEEDETPSRSDDLSKKEKVEDFLLDLYDAVEKGFQDQSERTNDLQEYWDLYNCKLGGNQFYSGNSKIFVPIIRDAVTARKMRFGNQIFPKTGRYVDAVTEDAETPFAQVALAEHYVRKAKLRTLISALLKNGDIEGSYHVYVRWAKRKRYITQKIDNPIIVDEDTLDPDLDAEDVQEDVELAEEYPIVEVIGDSDICILPATADSIEDALEEGGSATILRRWSKAKIKRMIKEKEISRETGKDILDEMSKDVKSETPDKEKQMVDAAGIKRDGRGKYCLVYETWHLLDVDGKKKRCRSFFVKPRVIGSCKRNPLWCDRIPILSCPVDKVQGSVKGISLLASVKDIQYFCNDTINEAADSAAYAMMPIIMTDPEKNPRVGSMILSLAAVWEVDPRSTQFAKFPDLWKDGLEIVTQGKNQIFQSLSVNPAQITQQAMKQKRNQAEIANEQQIDLLTTADAVTTLEEGILSPVVTLMMEMDYQYRDEEMSIPRYGELGRELKMQVVPPIQMGHRIQYYWLGVESARNAQMIQQQIASLNVLRGIPPQMYQGYKINMAPAIISMLEGVFGPRVAPRIFEDIRYQMSQDPQAENEMAFQGIKPFVHPLDDHKTHLAAHMQALPMDPNPNGVLRQHIAEHQQAMASAMMAQMQSMQGGAQGAPGGAGPGGAGMPKPGAQPAQGRPAQGPPGMIHNDRMPLAIPRR